jgi:hypothetical protein
MTIKIQILIFKIKMFFQYLIYLYQMLKMSSALWKTNSTIQKKEVLPVLIVHFNPAISSPEEIVGQLDEAVSKPYKKLHGYPPVVLVMPIGMTFSALSFDSFVDVLGKEQLREFKKAIYKKTNGIQLVQDIN